MDMDPTYGNSISAFASFALTQIGKGGPIEPYVMTSTDSLEEVLG